MAIRELYFKILAYSTQNFIYRIKIFEIEYVNKVYVDRGKHAERQNYIEGISKCVKMPSVSRLSDLQTRICLFVFVILSYYYDKIECI